MLVKKKVLEKAKPVMNTGEGLIARLPDSTEDPIAVFKWKEQVCAVRDICPHAGFSLADGAFDRENGGDRGGGGAGDPRWRRQHAAAVAT